MIKGGIKGNLSRYLEKNGNAIRLKLAYRLSAKIT